MPAFNEIVNNLNNQVQQLRETAQPQLQRLREINCVKDVKFPVSYSLQSVDIKPTEEHPGLVTLTLRVTGEVRVVHGNKDIYEAVQNSFPKKEDAAEGAEAKEPEEKDGVWIMKTKKKAFFTKDGLLVRIDH